MDRPFNTLLKKAGFLAGALFLGWTAQAKAQSTTNNSADSTRHQYGMHRGFGRDGDGWASRGGRDGFRDGRGHFGRSHNGIHYTPEQCKQLMAINKEYREKSADLFKQDNITLKEYKAGLIALQKEKKDKMAALLTPQQKDRVATHRKRMDENRQVMEAARLERLKLRLNLTDDQVAKIKTGTENLHNQVKAIHENDNLLPQQKREQMKALLAKRNDTFKSVLTPEQYSQFEKMHNGFRGRDGFGPGWHRGPGVPQGPSDGDAI